MGELKFLIPYKAVLLHQYGTAILAFVAVLFMNVFAVAFAVNRRFFLKDTAGNSPISTSSYTSSTENCPHLRLIPLTRSWTEMSRSYSPDEMSTPRDPSREPRGDEPARNVTRKARTRAEVAAQTASLARTKRQKFGSWRLVPLSLGSPTNIAAALTRSEALKFRL